MDLEEGNEDHWGVEERKDVSKDWTRFIVPGFSGGLRGSASILQSAKNR
jgi:hypothetical protein